MVNPTGGTKILKVLFRMFAFRNLIVRIACVLVDALEKGVPRRVAFLALLFMRHSDGQDRLKKKD